MIDEKKLEEILEKLECDIEVSYDYNLHRFIYQLNKKIKEFRNLESLMDWLVKHFEEK